jgi:hypothetical protein
MRTMAVALAALLGLALTLAAPASRAVAMVRMMPGDMPHVHGMTFATAGCQQARCGRPEGRVHEGHSLDVPVHLPPTWAHCSQGTLVRDDASRALPAPGL